MSGLAVLTANLHDLELRGDAMASVKPVKGPSGQHPIMQEVRKRLESLTEHQLQGDLANLHSRIDRLKEETTIPPSEKDTDPPDTLPEGVALDIEIETEEDDS